MACIPRDSGTKITALGAFFRVFRRLSGNPAVIAMLLLLLTAAPVFAQAAPEAMVRSGVTGRTVEFSGRMLVLLCGYSAAIVLGSLLGGWLASLVNLTHTVSQTIISFVGGLRFCKLTRHKKSQT